MRTPLRLVGLFHTLLALAVSSTACSEDGRVDPTSPEALRRAEPLKYGCSYVYHEVTNEIGGRQRDERTPDCSVERRCDEISPPDPFRYGVGADVYSSYVFFEDQVDFVGTCDAPVPISCDDLVEDEDTCVSCQARSCCVPVYLCEHDPNCVAIIDCLAYCKEDQACQQRCLENGDYRASQNLRAAVSCSMSACTTACGW